MQIIVTPAATAVRRIVFLCFNLEETNPEHVRDIKYPDADIKKNEPAWSGVKFISVRIVGIKGARMIRTVKLKKKILVSKNNGKTSDLVPLLFSFLKSSTVLLSIPFFQTPFFFIGLFLNI